MNILFVSNLYPPSVLGGYEILAADVARGLIRRGHDVTVQTSSFHPQGAPRPSLTGPSGEPVTRNLRLIRPFDESLNGKARSAHLAAERENRLILKRTIDRLKPDCVFFWSLRRLTLGPVRAAMAADIPYAATLNDMYLTFYAPPRFSLVPRRMAGFFLDLTLARRTTLADVSFPALTVISRTLVEALERDGVPASHAQVIYQGVDPEIFAQKNCPGGLHKPARLLYVGQLYDYKGVHTAVEALGLLKSRGIGAHLTIAGAGDESYADRLRNLAERLGVAAQTEFMGRVPRERLPELYRTADVFVFPSIWDEPFGLTHLEAMASGLPVASTTRGGPGEFLKDGVNALTFPAGDGEALADRLARLIREADLRRDLAIAGRQEVATRFNTTRYLDEIEAFLVDTVRRWPELARRWG
ncbi:MAG: glycosyltransferase [Myxococcales bacterium]|nr:MAG: glycosyltransferase [Myxococcales bacterium]